jgi:hypothetical protein
MYLKKMTTHSQAVKAIQTLGGYPGQTSALALLISILFYIGLWNEAAPSVVRYPALVTLANELS